MHPSIGLIILSCSRKEMLTRVLDAVCFQQPPFDQIIVSDNLSLESGEIKSLIVKYPNVTLLANPANLGYSAGFNRAEKLLKTDWAVFLVDDVVPRADFLKRIYEGILQNAGTSLFGIVLHNEDGSLNYAGGYQEIKSWHRIRLEEKVPEAGSYPDVSYVTGACMIAKRSLFEKLNGFDENFFIYLEDADFCLRALKHEASIKLISDCRAIHIGPHASGTSEFMQHVKRNNFYRFHFKHASGRNLWIFILRLLSIAIRGNQLGWKWIARLPQLLSERKAYRAPSI